MGQILARIRHKFEQIDESSGTVAVHYSSILLKSKFSQLAREGDESIGLIGEGAGKSKK